ncbi:MAG: hypothetical protein OEW58_11085 [Gammaproteobacteria bacterium]|nr:hypothetical protein [Gammaproteobacteria bacterium]
MKVGVACYTPKIMALVASSLRGVRGMRITWMTSDADELSILSVQSPADVVLMCVSFVRRSTQEQLRELCQDLQVPVILLIESDKNEADDVARAMSCGVKGISVIDYALFEKGEGANQLVLNISRFARTKAKANTRLDVNSQEDLGKKRQHYLVAVGSSSGGPQALMELLAAMSGNSTASFVIAQHMDKEFVPRFAQWLEQQSGFTVKLIDEGERLRPSMVYLGNGQGHVVLKRGQTLGYQVAQAGEPYCPSANVLFHSVVDRARLPCCAVLLSGMGEDGAAGMLEMKQAGFYTVAQDEKSAAVNGMPKAAVDLGAATDVLAAADIAKALMRRYEADHG